MHCREFDQQLHELLDQRRDPAGDERLCAHAEGCEPCRQLLAGQQALFAGLAALPVPNLAGDFSRRVVRRSGAVAGWSRIVRAAGGDRSRAYLALGVPAATAAAVLLAICVVWYARSGPVVANAPQSPAPALAISAEQQANSAAPRSRTGGTVGLTQRSLLIEAPRLPQHVRGGYQGAIDNLSTRLPETVEQLQDVERVAPGIRPIRTTFGRLWDALCGTDPAYRASPQPRPQSGAGLPPAAQRRFWLNV